MKLFRTALIFAPLFLLAAPVSHAAITCVADDAICDAITIGPITTGPPESGVEAGINFPIPSDVPRVSFYAQGGKGGDGIGFPGATGGGGACAYFLSSPGVYTYLLCVGGGGGSLKGSGGAGGSTANASAADGGVGRGAFYSAGHYINGFDGIKNDAGGGGGNYSATYRGGAGGTLGHGGYVAIGSYNGGGAGAGGDIFTSAGNGANSYPPYNMALGGTYLSGGGACFCGGGGGGGWGGGGAGDSDNGNTQLGGGCSPPYTNEIATSGGGGSSYFHPLFSAPNADGYISIPTSAFGLATSGGIGFDGKGWTVKLAAGFGGYSACRALGNAGDPGTITMSYLCSAKRGQLCGSLVPNSCGDPNPYAVYDCVENCVDYSTGIGQPATAIERPPVACTVENACGQTNTGTVACDYYSCSATPPPVTTPTGETYLASCNSPTNACGDYTSGNIQCDGTCSAITPFTIAGTSCPLTSNPNACGQTTTSTDAGTYSCSNTCDGTPPPPPPHTNCPPPTTPTISGLYQGGLYRGPTVLGNNPTGYQLYAVSVSPANFTLTYYFEWSKDGVNWTGDPNPPIGSWSTLP